MRIAKSALLRFHVSNIGVARNGLYRGTQGDICQKRFSVAVFLIKFEETLELRAVCSVYFSFQVLADFSLSANNV